jgi:hypothetical protein
MDLNRAETEARGLVEGWSQSSAAMSWVPDSRLTFDSTDWAFIDRVARVFGMGEFSRGDLVRAVEQQLAERVAAAGVSGRPEIGWVARMGLTGWITQLIGEAVIEYFREKAARASLTEDVPGMTLAAR